MRLSRLFIISRPIFWPIPVLAFIIGLATGPGFSVFSTSHAPIIILEIAMLTLPLSLIAFGINDYYDTASDSKNARKGSIGGAVLQTHEKTRLMRAIIASIVICVLTSAVASYAAANIINLIAMTLLVALLIAYSMPPVRLKERPPLDSFVNGMLWLGPFLLGHSFGAINIDAIRKAAILCVAVAAIHMYASIVDYTPDRRAAHKTFAVVMGPRATAIAASALIAVALLYGGFSTVVARALAAMLCVTIFTAAVRENRIERVAYFGAGIIYAIFIIAAVMFLM